MDEMLLKQANPHKGHFHSDEKTLNGLCDCAKIKPG